MLNIQKMDLLIAVYMFCIAVSELMGAKTFPLFSIGSFPLHASVGIFVVPIIYTINDTVAEVFGKQRAQSIVRSGLFTVLLFILFALLATSLPASKNFLASEKAYNMVFGVSIRIALSSLISFTIAEFTDIFIFVKLREKMKKKQLWLRTNAANVIGQFLDTAIFMTLAFYALNRPFMSNVIFLAGLILPYWLLKCCMSVIETPLVYLGVRWLRKEG